MPAVNRIQQSPSDAVGVNRQILATAPESCLIGPSTRPKRQVGTTGLEEIDPGLFGSGRFLRRMALSGGGPSYHASTARLPDGTRRDVLTRDAAVP